MNAPQAETDTKAERSVTPALAVIIVAFNHEGLLDECLAALMAQAGAGQLEIHVVSKRTKPPTISSHLKTTAISWHQVATTRTIPEMRREGIINARAGLLALLEDDCMVQPQWLQSVLEAHRTGHVAVGGAIEPNHYPRGLDWGIFYCEYARFLEPLTGTVPALPGNNVSYPTKSLNPSQFERGFYEVFVHQSWQQTGSKLFASQGMVVKIKNHWRLSHCTISPFHHGRAYAGQRFGGRFSIKRLAYCVLAPLLPFVKTARTLREVSTRQRKDLPLARAVAWIFLFQTCWSAGEFVGYLAGGGNSHKKWR